MIKFILLASCVAYATALFQCPPNYCDTLDCMRIDDCNGEVRANGGWCGCCDVCITQLGAGESCAHMMLLGVPATQECAKGLVCDRNTWTCAKPEQRHVRAVMGACAARLEQIRQARQNGLPLIGVTEPKCDDNGNFNAVQCTGSVCFCVDESGSEITDYQASIGELANMNCQCAKDKVAYMKTGLIGKLFFCDKYGNYKNTQGSVTTKAPTNTGLLTGTGTGGQVAGSGFFGSPSGASGPCAVELSASRSNSLLGAFVPNCDADGKYAPRQCKGSECYCVRKDGTKIEGYSAPIASKYQVTCQCARDKDMALAGGLFGEIHTCRKNGNYQQYQCLGSVCYCTDDSGARLTSQSVSIANINDLKC